MAVPADLRSAIIMAYGGRCQWCGAPEADHIDHIVPRAAGGDDAIENLTLACARCNLKKGDKLVAEPYAGILLARAEAKRPAIERLRRKKTPSGGPRPAPAPAPAPVAPSQRFFSFDEVDPFWDEASLAALFGRCALAVFTLPGGEDHVPVLMAGSAGGAYRIGVDHIVPIVEFRDVLRRRDLAEVSLRPRLGYEGYALDRTGRSRRVVEGGNLIVSADQSPEAWIFKVCALTVRRLTRLYTPQALASSIASRIDVPVVAGAGG